MESEIAASLWVPKLELMKAEKQRATATQLEWERAGLSNACSLLLRHLAKVHDSLDVDTLLGRLKECWIERRAFDEEDKDMVRSIVSELPKE